MATRYSKDFDPILLERQTANLFGSGLPGDGLPVRCLAVGALPQYEKDFGALTAGVWLEAQTDSNLIVPRMTLAVYRMKVITDMRVRLLNPSAIKQWRTRDTTFYLPPYPYEGSNAEQQYVWRQGEFMVFEDQSYPGFDLYSRVASTVSIVQFSGWRYALEKIADGRGTIDVWVNDWPSTRNK